MKIELVNVTTANDWHDYHALRRKVLWEARGRSGYDENHLDDRLPANHPLLLKVDDRSIGTVRVDDFGNGTGAIRLVAIADDAQRQGYGRALSHLVDKYAHGLGLRALFVNAAPDAVGYYEKTGWRAFVWDAAELTGFAADCTQMSKSLSLYS
jgi:N-acetylglutamate synthase-like GNAT family acetyltransferase